MTVSTKHYNTRVTLEHIGEGYNGDYDPNDPDDVPLLRFTIEHADAIEPTSDDEFEPVEDGSYCTGIPADTPEDVQRALADIILQLIAGRVRRGASVKRVAEKLSWLTADPEVLRTIRREAEREDD